MKVITCAGYYNTGSSAVTDYFSEFDNIKSFGEVEIRFLQEPDGVATLESNIIDHPHRHNTTHAIKRFIKYSKFENGNFLSKRYRKIWGDSYWKYTMEYLNDIVQLSSISYWRQDKIARGEIFYMLDALLTTLTLKVGGKKCITSFLHFSKERGYFTSIDKRAFYSATQKYTHSLFKEIADQKEYLMLDQLVPPSDIDRYFNYVKNLYVVVVDRDPRDLYILTKLVPFYEVVPHPLDEFCKWYKITRKQAGKEGENSRILRIYFEDLIYRYDETTDKLKRLIGIDDVHHTKKHCFFKPEKSMENTQLWKKYPKYTEDIKYIERELGSYLYKYEE